MAKITAQPNIQLTVTFTVSEAEARALDALVGYGDDAFVQVFYDKLGKHYMHPHEGGLREFFKTIRESMPGILQRTDEARQVFSGEKVAACRTK